MGKVSALWVHASADWIKMMNGIGLTCSYVFVIKEPYQNLYQFCFCCILMPLVKFKRNGLWRGWMGCVVGVWNNYNTSVCVCHLSRRTAGPMMSWAPNTWGETSTTPGRLQRWPSWVLRYKTHKQINTPTLCVRGDMTFHGKVISLFKETIRVRNTGKKDSNKGVLLHVKIPIPKHGRVSLRARSRSSSEGRTARWRLRLNTWRSSPTLSPRLSEVTPPILLN